MKMLDFHLRPNASKGSKCHTFKKNITPDTISKRGTKAGGRSNFPCFLKKHTKKKK